MTTTSLQKTDEPQQARRIRLAQALGWQWYHCRRQPGRVFFLSATGVEKSQFGQDYLFCAAPDPMHWTAALRDAPDFEATTPEGAHARERLRLHLYSLGCWTEFEGKAGATYCVQFRSKDSAYFCAEAESYIEAFVQAAEATLPILAAEKEKEAWQASSPHRQTHRQTPAQEPVSNVPAFQFQVGQMVRIRDTARAGQTAVIVRCEHFPGAARWRFPPINGYDCCFGDGHQRLNVPESSLEAVNE